MTPKRKIPRLMRMLPGVKELEKERDDFVEISINQTRMAEQHQHKAARLEKEVQLAERLLKSKIPAYYVENCAQSLVQDIVTEALKAMKVVYNERQSMEGRGYVIGIRIPELNMRRYIGGTELALGPVTGDVDPEEQVIRHIDARLFEGKGV